MLPLLRGVVNNPAFDLTTVVVTQAHEETAGGRFRAAREGAMCDRPRRGRRNETVVVIVVADKSSIVWSGPILYLPISYG